MTPIELWFSVLFSDEVEGSQLSLDPNDPGNWTGGVIGSGTLRGSRYGISCASFPQEDIANMTLDRAAELGTSKYWQRYDLDKFPPGVAILMADVYWNGGLPVQWLQSSVGADPDGIFGPVSMAALNEAMANPGLVFSNFLGWRLDYEASLPISSKFMRGWAKRCNLMLIAALNATYPKMSQ
jgi:lysozyme family protein